jgi:prolyl-tRNA editing enzyme YbaK/EbsC (Cys-tRNA(Pro) deacylase)
MPSSPRILRLHPTRALKARLSAVHAGPGIVLLLTGVAALSEARGPHSHGPAWLPWLMIAAGAAVLASIVWELRTHHPHHHSPVGWTEMFAGVMLVVEGLHLHRPHDAFQAAYGYYSAGVLAILVGLNHARLAGLRRLRVDDLGFDLRLGPFRGTSARWDALAAVARDGNTLVVTPRAGGERRQSLEEADNRDEAFALLRAHAARHGVTSAPLSRSATRVQDALRALGSDARVVALDEPGRTAADAARVLDCEVGRIVKSLVFRGATSGRALLVLASGANRVDESKLAALAGETAGRASPEFVREHTGFTVGGVAPVGHPAALPCWIDEDLLAHESVWASAGAAEAFVRLDPRDLARLTGGTVARIR